MALHDDLVEQANMLATCDPLKPKQANLRRAVSAAYYALFHFLIARASASLVGAAFNRKDLRHLLSRLFDHGEMKAACSSFGGGTLPEGVNSVVGAIGIPASIRDIANTFKQMQNLRHLADYDLAHVFGKFEVTEIIKRIQQDMAAFDASPPGPIKDLFFLALLTWEKVRKRT